MKSSMIVVLVGIALCGCDKQQQTTATPPTSAPPALDSVPAANRLPTTAPEKDKAAHEEKAAREAAEQILSDWSGGSTPPQLQDLTSTFATRHILLDYKLGRLRGGESISGEKGKRYSGTVNLQLETEGGTPATRQYLFLLQESSGRWTLMLLDR